MRPAVKLLRDARALPHQSSTAGTTLIELVVVMVIVAVAMSIYSGLTVVAGSSRAINRENAIAAEAVRVVIESMRNEQYRLVFALFNADPDDDPAGAGTGPGHRFAVEGLIPVPTSLDGLVGEVSFPALSFDDAASPGWQLRESFVDERLGMPRDLSGDSMIDTDDHSDDYILLPVRVRIEWDGTVGPRSIEAYTMLADFQA